MAAARAACPPADLPPLPPGPAPTAAAIELGRHHLAFLESLTSTNVDCLAGEARVFRSGNF